MKRKRGDRKKIKKKEGVKEKKLELGGIIVESEQYKGQKIGIVKVRKGEKGGGNKRKKRKKK